MEYRIEYANGNCHNYANNRKDLLEWLSILRDEVITDIQKIWKDGKTESVMEKYMKYIKNRRKHHGIYVVRRNGIDKRK